MLICETLALADRIRCLIRRAEHFGHSREDILEEVSYVARDLERYAAQIEDAAEKEYLDSMADYAEYVRG